jgi:hypothetical protein
MKLKDILHERNLGGERRQGFQWSQQLNVDRQLRIVRDFLRDHPDPEAISVYKQAVSDKQFDSRGLKYIQSLMAEYNWSPA